MDPIPFKSISLKHKPDYYFMSVVIRYKAYAQRYKMYVSQLKFAIHRSLRGLFGDVGNAIEFDVLQYNDATRNAILRIPYSAFVKFWAALTFVTICQGQPCHIRVQKVSTCLPSLIHNSRTFKHKSEPLK